MYFEAVIDFEEFKKDYLSGLSANKIKNKYGLTGRQYRKLCNENNLVRDMTFLRKNPQFDKSWRATYMTKTKSGTYSVRKVFKNKMVHYGTYKNKEVAEHIVEELKKVDWDKKKLDKIKREMRKEEWYMNLINEQIRIIRTQLTAEKNKETPNKRNIKKLDKELTKLLREVDL